MMQLCGLVFDHFGANLGPQAASSEQHCPPSAQAPEWVVLVLPLDSFFGHPVGSLPGASCGIPHGGPPGTKVLKLMILEVDF